MAVDNVQIQFPGDLDHLPFQEEADPVLGFLGELDRGQAVDPVFRKGVGMLYGKYEYVVSPVLQFGL
jgi:hypothetical protein